MKRHGFILTEILTGMMLQAGFIIVLCSAFYMILNFSTSTQQGFAANDKGQMVIAYFDSRIRNAGLGMWACNGSKDIRVALQKIPALTNDTDDNKKLCLPVALLYNASGTPGGHETLSHDRTGRFYRGNVLTLLYAHKDTHDGVRLILVTDKNQTPVTLVNDDTSSNDFFLIDSKTNDLNSYKNSQLGKASQISSNLNIKSYAVMENVGIPVSTQKARNATKNKDLVRLRAYTENQPTIYPMTELLNLECQKLYVGKDTNGYNFKFMELNDSGNWGNAYYHTKDILDLYMTLDTSPNTTDKIPIFELRVLVSEGLNEIGTTDKPKDWPGRWNGTDFNTHKVHVSKATWKLYNLAPFFAN